MEGPSKIEISTRISQIVVSSAINVEDPHEIVVLSSREADFMLGSVLRSDNGASSLMVKERLNQMFGDKFMVVLFGAIEVDRFHGEHQEVPE